MLCKVGRHGRKKMAIEISQSAIPYSLDAEQTVLGTIIIDSSAMVQVAAFLRPEHFHISMHSKLFGVMNGMFIGNTPIDLVTVIEHSVMEKVFENQDEARGYLLKLAESVVNPTGVADYAKIIVEKHMLRTLMYACRDIYDMAAAGTDKPSTVMDIAEKMIYDIRGERELSGLKEIRPILTEKVKQLEEACKNPGARPEGSLSTSYSDLDRKIFGLNPSALIIIAGRPAMGKTSFALNLAVGSAKLHPEKAVAIFSLEMSGEELVTRMISTETRIPSDQMRDGQIDDEGWRSITEGVGILSGLRIYVDGSSNPSVGEMKAKLRRVKNLGLVVIDYLQLMSIGRRDVNRTQEVSEITRSLKLLAKELNIPVIVASQLSRDSAKKGQRPALPDLRESGSIEQDADIVMFLHREHYYNPDFDKPYLCECIIAKHRQGETGTVNLHWDERYTKFSTLDFRYESNE